jgi:hypothetical protein
VACNGKGKASRENIIHRGYAMQWRWFIVNTMMIIDVPLGVVEVRWCGVVVLFLIRVFAFCQCLEEKSMLCE